MDLILKAGEQSTHKEQEGGGEGTFKPRRGGKSVKALNHKSNSSPGPGESFLLEVTRNNLGGKGRDAVEMVWNAEVVRERKLVAAAPTQRLSRRNARTAGDQLRLGERLFKVQRVRESCNQD